MTPIPYLTFHGNCLEALETYRRIFDAPEPNVMTFGEAPQDVRDSMPETSPQAVLHAALKIGDGWIYGSDDIMGGTPRMAGCSVTVDLPDAARARAVFDALADHGEVHMAFSPTFWSKGFGMLTDRYGIRWMIGVESEGTMG
ncbi:PhnB protein [Limimaricola variabilis]|uniref:PhnB protein n=1 Tax=Limimaricola variabilis TaxID=1492771 RepID=A0ABR6HMF2_9RHOB|nr:VOC family protein [Limimaricola variabilis]MBB3711581.1 PhnB protein [Limimaricola variabilis]